jgi:hypothetical protein
VRARGLPISFVLLSFVLIFPGVPRAQQQAAGGIPAPEAHFGFRMGADGYLASADATEKYFELVAAGSDRVKVVDLGPTTENHRTIAAVVSSPENIRNLDQIKRDNQRLADPRTLPPDEANRIAASHKVVVAIGGSIHATEVGGTQAANHLLFELAASDDPAIVEQLRNVVLIVIPMLNPDGNRLVVDWYNKFRSTPFDGGPMPAADHKYAGHDINRDGFMMNLAESRNVARFFNAEWHPQVFLSMHQMEGDGPRFYAPPNSDPIHPNYDPIIWREAALLGAAMTLELERDQRAGVASSSPFDYYWPGYEDSVPLGHNTVCLLTEAASARVASTVAETKADPYGQIDLPHPWPGGPWRLRDIVDYNLSAMHGLLRGAAAYRVEIVRNFYDMGRRAVEAGVRDAPFAFVIPPEQHDVLALRKLEELLLLGGIEIQRAQEPFRAGATAFPAGSDLIFLSQPYRAYVKTLLERQNYPTPAGIGQRPYDATGWTLPAQMGVDVRTVERTFDLPLMSKLNTPAISSPAGKIWGEKKPGYFIVDARGTAGALARNRLLAAGVQTSWLPNAMDVNGFRYVAGSIVVPAVKEAEPVLAAIARQLDLRVDGAKGKPPVQASAPASAAASTPGGRPRVGVYKPAGDNSDEGWTRWLLEQYEFAFTSIDSTLVRAGGLRTAFDAIILPGATAELLLNGLPKDTMPPGYGAGLGEEGVRELEAFVNAGGTLICLDQAGGFAIDAFKLPIKDVARQPRETFFGPGSLLNLEFDTAQPLAYGMPARGAAFFADGSAYDVPQDASLTTVARYAAKDLLVSGLLQGESVIAGRPAVVSASVGAGRVVLFGFRVQHRGQSYATFRLLFNAIFAAR